MVTHAQVQQSYGDAVANEHSARNAQLRTLREIARRDALSIYRQGEDAIALYDAGVISYMADDAVDISCDDFETLSTGALDSRRRCYWNAFFAEVNSLESN